MHELIHHIVPDADTEVKTVHKAKGKAPRQHPVDKHRRQNADAGIKNTVQRVGDVGIYRGIEQQNAQHHAAGLNTAHPHVLAQQNQQNYLK